MRAYSKIESGETQLTIERLNELITILGIAPHEIFQFKVPNEHNKHKENNTQTNPESISLVQHYEETIVMLKEHIEILKLLLQKK